MTAADILYSFPRKIDLGLARVAAALEALGRPQDLIPPVIHVAGTNGKGSTVAFLRAMAEAAGMKAHVYTSPHLVSIHERWRIAGTLITEEELLDYARRVQALTNQIPVTVFEAETLIAFLAFSEATADVTVFEVGLGGRLDATNIVTKPTMTVITPIDMDHSEMLGDSIAKIAREKAGILKPRVPCVVGRQHDEARAVIEARAKALESPLLIFGENWDCYQERDRLIVQTEKQLLDLPLPPLAGAHQLENAGAAAVAMLHRGQGQASIAAGIEATTWPGRLQKITEGPYAVLAAASDSEIWLDGGHNPHGAAAAARHIEALTKRDPRPVALVCGMLGTKDPVGFFQAFKNLQPLVFTVPIVSSDAGIPPSVLAGHAAASGYEASAADTPLEGVKHALEKAGPRARILICGSLYLAGDILSQGPALT